MDFGLRGGAEMPGFLGFLAGQGKRKLRALAGHAEAYAGHHGIGSAFRHFISDKTGLSLSFHPAAPDIVFQIDGGYIVMEAETLGAGPGYHAFIVGFIDYLRQQHQWVWRFDDTTRYFTDDTGYYSERNFAALQAAMAAEFETLRTNVLAAEPDTPLCYDLWLPTQFTFASGYFTATSLGFRDRLFFERPHPDQFFPWWDEGVTTRTLKNLVLSKLWLEIDWRPPTTATERGDLEQCRDLIDHARQRGVEFAAGDGVDDIDALLRDEWPAEDGDGGRIGYWRQALWYPGPDDWSVALPGYYREETSADGQSCVIYYGNRAVQVTGELYDEALPQPSWPDLQLDGYSEYLRFETGQYRAVVLSGRQSDYEDEGRWTWLGLYGARHGYAMITATSTDENDGPWAERVLRSIRRLSPDNSWLPDDSLEETN